MATGLRLLDDNGKRLPIFVYDSEVNAPNRAAIFSDRYGLMWSTEQYGVQSPEYQINGERYYYDSTNKVFHLGSVTTNSISALVDIRTFFAMLVYDKAADKIGWWITTFSYGIGAYGSWVFRTCGVPVTPYGPFSYQQYPDGPTTTWGWCLDYITEKIDDETYPKGGAIRGNNDDYRAGRAVMVDLYFLTGSDETRSKFSGSDITSMIASDGRSQGYGTLSYNAFVLDHPDHVEEYDPSDPYNPGGDSGDDEEPSGTFDPNSDEIPMSTLPSISSANTGFTRIYNPTLAQVRSLSNYLWTDATLLQTLWNQIKQFLENPMDAFIAFNLVPCLVPNGGTEEFKLMFIPTGVQLTVATSQFVDVDCGSYKIEPYYGSALDYSPYTKVSLFLPYIGTVQLDTDEVMGKTVSVKYRIDIVSGGCVAHVMVDGSVTYQYSGHCAINIPFTSADFTGYVSAMIQAAKAVTSLAAGATGAGALASELAGLPSQRTGSVNETITTTMRNPSSGRQITSGRQVTERETVTGTNASFASLVAANVVNTVNTVMGSKPLVERSGTFSGTTGYLGVRRPYLIIEIPRIANPAKYGEFNGRPCAMTLKLGDISGFTQVQQVQLTNFTATNPELDEIGGFLKSGVIL